jgi:GT2 family glycosyltransferase
LKPLGIVIPIYNQLPYLQKLLNTIEKQVVTKRDYVVIALVDNGSTEDIHGFLSEHGYSHTSHPDFPKITGHSDDGEFFVTRLGVGSDAPHSVLRMVHYIHNTENKGFSYACNQGMKSILEYCAEDTCDADILLLNTDMELLPDCIDNLIDCADKLDSIGIVGGRLLFPNGRLQHAGAFISVYGWGQHKGAGQVDSDEFAQPNIEEEEYVTGALFYIKNEVIKKIGYLDERFNPAYFEEVDYCYSARKAGFKVVYTPFAKAIHHESATGKAVYKSEQAVSDISRKNQIKFYLKHDEDEYVPTSDQKLLITSRIYGDWSFCHVMRNLAKGLKYAGVDVAIAPEEYHQPQNMDDWAIKEMINKPKDYWNRTILRSSEGDHMYMMPPGKKRIAHTTGESTRISRAWRDQLNASDMVVTTSRFFHDVLLEGGVTKPLFVLPNSVDVRTYNPDIPKYAFKSNRTFNFLSMFHFGERKSPETVFRAFVQEFKEDEDVALTVHSLSMGFVLQNHMRTTIKDWVGAVTGGQKHAPIFVTTDYIQPNIMPHYMRNFDVFVLPSRAEGFGLPILEAAALGIPSIATNWSGIRDLVTSDTGWGLDYKLVDIPLQVLPYFKNYVGGQWAEPDVDHLRRLMRHAFENRDEVKTKGKNAQKAAQNYSVERVGLMAQELFFT